MIERFAAEADIDSGTFFNARWTRRKIITGKTIPFPLHNHRTPHRLGHNEEDAFFLLIYRLGGSMYYDHADRQTVWIHKYTN